MQTRMRVLSRAGAAALTAALAGCAVPAYNYPASPAANSAAVEYGRITNVVLISNGTAVAGPNTAGGTVTGPVYRIWVQTDSGVIRAYDVGSMGNLHPGDRVRIENGLIYLS